MQPTPPIPAPLCLYASHSLLPPLLLPSAVAPALTQTEPAESCCQFFLAQLGWDHVADCSREAEPQPKVSGGRMGKGWGAGCREEQGVEGQDAGAPGLGGRLQGVGELHCRDAKGWGCKECVVGGARARKQGAVIGTEGHVTGGAWQGAEGSKSWRAGPWPPATAFPVTAG